MVLEATTDETVPRWPSHFQGYSMQKVVNTGIALPAEVHLLLRDAARGVQRAKGGRVSVSALVSELVRRHETELRKLAYGGSK